MEDRFKLCGLFYGNDVEIVASHHAFMLMDYVRPEFTHYSESDLLETLDHMIDFLGGLITTLKSTPPSPQQLRTFALRYRINLLSPAARQSYYDDTVPSDASLTKDISVNAAIDERTGELLNPVWVRLAIIQLGGIKACEG